MVEAELSSANFEISARTITRMFENVRPSATWPGTIERMVSGQEATARQQGSVLRGRREAKGPLVHGASSSTAPECCSGGRIKCNVKWILKILEDSRLNLLG